MTAFNPMEGYTVAKNPWRNSSHGNGTHYFKTAYPTVGDSAEQQAQREQFTQARQQAKQQCSSESGMERAECIADTMSSILRN